VGWLVAMKTKTPIAVLISDIHYNLNTIQMADNTLCQAIEKANILEVPLIVAGDLHDTKANLRAECVNAMINSFSKLKYPCYIMVGNHDLINEKSSENSLNFLQSSLINIVSKPSYLPDVNAHLIPYQNTTEKVLQAIKGIPAGATLIMHQGVKGSNSGDYYLDHSAVNHESLKDYRVISGHYHTRQDIYFHGKKQPRDIGTFSYIGNPYTLNFGESKDPEKGFQILNSDGSLEVVYTKLRKHVLLEYRHEEIHLLKDYKENLNKDVLLKIRITGPKHSLASISKETISEVLPFFQSYALEFVPEDSSIKEETRLVENDADIVRSLVEGISAEDAVKKQLKVLFEEVLK
jgi:DNA repair exonuclease SbcCD nuclease subunit